MTKHLPITATIKRAIKLAILVQTIVFLTYVSYLPDVEKMHQPSTNRNLLQRENTDESQEYNTSQHQATNSKADTPMIGPSTQHAVTEEDVCFVTTEFSENVEDMDELPAPEMSRNNFQFYAFTNQKDWAVPQAFHKIVLSEVFFTPSIERLIVMSRWPKFLGWKHNRLKSCQIIFFLDAYLMNPINKDYWLKAARKLRNSQVGLMEREQIGITQSENAPIEELTKNARIGKVSLEGANYTANWLRQQPDYDPNSTTVYKNAIMGYDPSNLAFQHVAEEFWDEYSKEKGSWRDQSYWAYFLKRNRITPISFPTVHVARPPLGKQGKRGHNGHIYVKKHGTDDPKRKTHLDFPRPLQVIKHS